MKIFSLLGIQDFVLPLTIITALIISCSVWIAYKCVNKILDKKKALIFLCLAIITTPLYFYAVEYYTDSFSMIFSVLFLYLWLLIREKKKSKLFCVLYGFLLFIGMHVKITCSFVFIAIVLYEIINLNFKKNFFKITIIISSCIFLNLFYANGIEKLMIDEGIKDRYGIPYEHWIMMGLNDKGSFSFDEYAYIEKFNTYAEKKESARKRIKERVFNSSWNQRFTWFRRKISYTWNDGTYFSPLLLRREPVHENRIHSLVLQEYEKNNYYKYFPQIMHESMLLFILINIFNKIVKKDELKRIDTICLITMFGIMIFLLMWETRSRYLINLLPIIMIAQINGIDSFVNIIFNKRKQKKVKA